MRECRAAARIGYQPDHLYTKINEYADKVKDAQALKTG